MYTLASCQQLTRGDGGWPTAFVVVDGSAEVEILFFFSFFLLFQHDGRNLGGTCQIIGAEIKIE